MRWSGRRVGTRLLALLLLLFSRASGNLCPITPQSSRPYQQPHRSHHPRRHHQRSRSHHRHCGGQRLRRAQPQGRFDGAIPGSSTPHASKQVFSTVAPLPMTALLHSDALRTTAPARLDNDGVDDVCVGAVYYIVQTDPQERAKTTTASSGCRPRPTAPDPGVSHGNSQCLAEGEQQG